MNWHVVGALTRRYSYLYTRSWVRGVELFFWPVMELLVWGFLTAYLLEQGAGEFPVPASFLIGAMIFWDILFRAQQGVAICFLEDVWTRNLLNVFVAPVRLREYLAAGFAFGLLRIAVTVVVLAVLARVLYAFDLLVFELALLPFCVNLLVFGWALGLVTTALILRWGLAAEALAWAVPFFIQPFAAVFYPVSVYPEWLQYISWMIPCTPVFEGMRQVLATGGTLDPWLLVWATALNVVYLAAGAVVFAGVFRVVQDRGLLTRVSSH